MKQRIAGLVSNVLNPFVACLGIILVVSFESAAGTGEAVKWTLLTSAFSLLPLLLMVIWLTRRGRLDGVLVASRRQRRALYAAAIVSTTAGYLTLHYLAAPSMLLAAFGGGLATAVVFMAINRWWKISLHAAFPAGMAAVLVMLYGAAGVAAVLPVLVVGWSRVELGHHSPAQTVAGGVLAGVMAVVFFGVFGLL